MAHLFDVIVSASGGVIASILLVSHCRSIKGKKRSVSFCSGWPLTKRQPAGLFLVKGPRLECQAGAPEPASEAMCCAFNSLYILATYLECFEVPPPQLPPPPLRISRRTEKLIYTILQRGFSHFHANVSRSSTSSLPAFTSMTSLFSLTIYSSAWQQRIHLYWFLFNGRDGWFANF